MTAKPYQLLKPLTIGRTAHPAGAVVVLTGRQADWLAAQGVITKAGITAIPTPALLTTPRRTTRCCGWR